MSRHRFHGAENRFDVLAAFIAETYGKRVNTVADVAGGQGMLSRVLAKKYGYISEVIDPRGWRLKGVAGREEPFSAELADYYDLVVGLHPDQATRPVALAALVRPVILVPCCNFWSPEKLGQAELLAAIEAWLCEQCVHCRRVTFDFKGPKNVGLVCEPPGSTS